MKASLEINRDGQGKIIYGPENSPQHEQFFTKNGARDTVVKLLHSGDITQAEAKLFEREIAKAKDPEVTDLNTVRDLTLVLGGQVEAT